MTVVKGIKVNPMDEPESRKRPEGMSKSAWRRLKRRAAKADGLSSPTDTEVTNGPQIPLEQVKDPKESSFKEKEDCLKEALASIPPEQDPHGWAKLGFAALAATGLGIGVVGLIRWWQKKKSESSSGKDLDPLNDEDLEGLI